MAVFPAFYHVVPLRLGHHPLGSDLGVCAVGYRGNWCADRRAICHFATRGASSVGCLVFVHLLLNAPVIPTQAIANTIATNVKDIYEQTPALKAAIATLTPNGVPAASATDDASVTELFEGNGAQRAYAVDEVVGSSFETVKVCVYTGGGDRVVRVGRLRGAF